MSMGMMTLLVLQVLLLTILCIVLIVYVAANLIRKNKGNGYNPYEDPNMLKMLSEYDFEKIGETIDKFITDAGEEYKLENFSYKKPAEIYLTEDIMNTMIKYIVNKVMFRVTAQVFTVLKISYNIKNEEDLIKFLYEKARAYVLAYSIQVNGTLEE